MNHSISKLSQNIKDINIQGASNVAKVALNNISQIISKKNYSESADIFFDYNSLKRKIINLRPTEPLLENGFYFIESNWPKSHNVKTLKSEIKKVFEKYLLLIENNQQKIVKFGKNVIKDNENILTHCHSSSVEKIFIKAKKGGKKYFVFNTETRPLYQGRITAKNLIKNRIRTTMVVDSASSFLISRYSGKNLMMNKVLLGSDAMLWDGSIINKVGSYGISLAANHENVPLYITANLLKLDRDNKIKIEKREKKELWPRSPKNLRIINFAFDVVPAKFITGIICEFGVVKPGQVKSLVQKNYPWLIKK